MINKYVINEKYSGNGLILSAVRYNKKDIKSVVDICELVALTTPIFSIKVPYEDDDKSVRIDYEIHGEDGFSEYPWMLIKHLDYVVYNGNDLACSDANTVKDRLALFSTREFRKRFTLVK